MRLQLSWIFPLAPSTQHPPLTQAIPPPLFMSMGHASKWFDYSRGVQTFGNSGPHWKKSCFGSHIKYIAMHNHKKSCNILSKFTIFCWAPFISILGHTWPTGCGFESPAPFPTLYFTFPWLFCNYLLVLLHSLTSSPILLLPVSSGNYLVTNFLLLLLLRVLFILNLWLFNYDVSWSGPLCIHLVWYSLCFLDLHGYFLHQIKDIFFHYFFK